MLIPVVYCVWQPVPTEVKEVIARLRNCILALADHNMMLYDTSVMYAYEASTHYQVCKHCAIVPSCENVGNVQKDWVIGYWIAPVSESSIQQLALYLFVI